MKPALFFDRDGVINIDTHYLHKIEDFSFTPGLIECLSELTQHYVIIVVTNQSGIGRGYFTESEYKTLTEWMVNELQTHNVSILDVLHCPHAPEENCECRKPKPTLIQRAAQQYNIELSQSWMIGDKASDLECGYNAGISQLIFFNNGLNPITKALPFPYSSTDSMETLTHIILNQT